MIGSLMTALALGAALLALAVSVALLLKLNALEKATEEALRDIRLGLQTLRNAEDARMLREAEVGLTREQIDDTTIK